VLDWLDGLCRLGCGQISASLFFLLYFFYLFPVFYFAVSNTSLLFYFAGFELATHLQYLGFEFL
jgi:hypothetical protein